MELKCRVYVAVEHISAFGVLRLGNLDLSGEPILNIQLCKDIQDIEHSNSAGKTLIVDDGAFGVEMVRLALSYKSFISPLSDL